MDGWMDVCMYSELMFSRCGEVEYLDVCGRESVGWIKGERKRLEEVESFW